MSGTAVAVLFADTNPRAVWSLLHALRIYGVRGIAVRSARTHPRVAAALPASGLEVVERDYAEPPQDVLERLARAHPGTPLVLLPTSEYVNQAWLAHAAGFGVPPGVRFPGPDRETYLALTGKRSFRDALCAHSVRFRSAAVTPEEARDLPAVVAKPIANVAGGEVLVPAFVSGADVDRYPPDRWFLERRLGGRSFYLCGFMGPDRAVTYWQENHLQQPGGKSMIFCTLEPAPDEGVERDALGFLRAAGYLGVFMIDLVRAGDGWYPIEMNPRFWGPLRLAFSARPRLLRDFLAWAGLAPRGPVRGEAFDAYVWGEGLGREGGRVHAWGEGRAAAEALLARRKVVDAYDDLRDPG